MDEVRIRKIIDFINDNELSLTNIGIVLPYKENVKLHSNNILK